MTSVVAEPKWTSAEWRARAASLAREAEAALRMAAAIDAGESAAESAAFADLIKLQDDFVQWRRARDPNYDRRMRAVARVIFGRGDGK